MKKKSPRSKEILTEIGSITGLSGCRLRHYFRMSEGELVDTLADLRRKRQALVEQVAAETDEAPAMLAGYTVAELIRERAMAIDVPDDVPEDPRLRRLRRLAIS